jgi:hypothetical protein
MNSERSSRLLRRSLMVASVGLAMMLTLIARQALVDFPVIVAAEIEIVEPAPLPEPGRQAIAVAQITKRGADGQTVVTHGREDENLLERKGFGEQAVEPHVGK